MSDCLYESDWRSLDIPQQKHFILMISNAQRPMVYHGFGIVILNLATFTKVNRFEVHAFIRHDEFIPVIFGFSVWQNCFFVLHDVQNSRAVIPIHLWIATKM